MYSSFQEWYNDYKFITRRQYSSDTYNPASHTTPSSRQWIFWVSKEDGGPSGRPSVTKMDGNFKVPYTMHLPQLMF